MAEAQRKTFGGLSDLASAFDRFVVLRTRLLRMRTFLTAVQRPATLSPVRWMTASKPETSSGGMACMGSHGSAVASRVSRRTRRVTRYPRDSREGTKAEPMSPDAPLIRAQGTRTL